MFVTITKSDYWELIVKKLRQQGMEIPEGVDPTDIEEIELDIETIEIRIHTVQDVKDV